MSVAPGEDNNTHSPKVLTDLTESDLIEQCRREAEIKIKQPLFKGATPATPHLRQLKIEAELDYSIYNWYREEARVLLNEWFASQPPDAVITPEVRGDILYRAQKQHRENKRIRQTAKYKTLIAKGVSAHDALYVCTHPSSATVPSESKGLPPSVFNRTRTTEAFSMNTLSNSLPAEAPPSAVSIASTEVAPDKMDDGVIEDVDEEEEERSLDQSPAVALTVDQRFNEALTAYRQQYGRARSAETKKDVEEVVYKLVMRNNGTIHTDEQLIEAHRQLIALWTAQGDKLERVRQQQPQQQPQQQQPQVGCGHLAGGSGFGASPHPNQLVPYGQAKQYISSKFQASIIQPRDQELTRLRAEVDALEGRLRPNDPRYQQIVKASLSVFLRDGNGRKALDKRHKQLQKKAGQYQALVSQMDALRRELAEVRLVGEILTQKVAEDEEAYKQIINEEEARAEKVRREYEEKLANQRANADAKLKKKADALNASYRPGKSEFSGKIKRRFVDDEAEEVEEGEDEEEDEQKRDEAMFE